MLHPDTSALICPIASSWFCRANETQFILRCFGTVHIVPPFVAEPFVLPSPSLCARSQLCAQPNPVSLCLCTSKDGTPTSKTFEHVTSEIGAEEAEEVGVEHLLR